MPELVLIPITRKITGYWVGCGSMEHVQLMNPWGIGGVAAIDFLFDVPTIT